jgi:hypothetical protein
MSLSSFRYFVGFYLFFLDNFWGMSAYWIRRTFVIFFPFRAVPVNFVIYFYVSREPGRLELTVYGCIWWMH